MKHKIGARLGAFEQQTSNLRCLRHTTTSNNLLYMLKTSFKSFYYIFLLKTDFRSYLYFFGSTQHVPRRPSRPLEMVGPKKGGQNRWSKKDGRQGSNCDLRERGLAPYHYTTRPFLFCGGRSRFI